MTASGNLGAQTVITLDIGLWFAVQGQCLWRIQWRSAHNIHLSTQPNFLKPGDTSSSSRYFKKDIINEVLTAVDGLMPVPPGPGIGVTLDMSFLDKVSSSTETFSKGAR